MRKRDEKMPETDVPQPQAGDIVITRDPKFASRFSIRQIPGRPQVSWQKREAAITFSEAFAKKHLVDVWLNDGQVERRVVNRRAPEPASAD